MRFLNKKFLSVTAIYLMLFCSFSQGSQVVCKCDDGHFWINWFTDSCCEYENEFTQDDLLPSLDVSDYCNHALIDDSDFIFSRRNKVEIKIHRISCSVSIFNSILIAAATNFQITNFSTAEICSMQSLKTIVLLL